MITKQELIDVINAMPHEKFDDIEVVIEEIILFEKIKKGLAAVEKGGILSEGEFDETIERW